MPIFYLILEFVDTFNSFFDNHETSPSFIYKKQPQVFNSFPVWQKVLPGEEGYEDVGGVAAAQSSKTGESVNSTVKDVQVSDRQI